MVHRESKGSPHFRSVVPVWNMRLYVELVQEVDPYTQLEHFRSRQVGYSGNNDFWKTPSPEPEFAESLRVALHSEVREMADSAVGWQLCGALRRLAANVRQAYDPRQLLLVSILRAGVPIADWLRALLPGSEAVMASLFVGTGIDREALAAIQSDFPDRQILFVDGWTGKGGVADTLRELGAGDLAVLVDPWRLASFRGTSQDLLCPSALFTGPTTLGFSRSFVHDEAKPFRALRFPSRYLDTELVSQWRSLPKVWQRTNPPLALENEASEEEFVRPERTTNLRIHANEVCRALINSNPDELRFYDDPAQAKQEFRLLVQLAEIQHVPIRYACRELSRLHTRVACSLKLQ